MSTPRRFRIARPAARSSGVGSAAVQADVLDLEVRHGLELLDEVFLLGVARPLVGLQLRDDSRIRAEALLHHLEDHGLPSVRGMLAQAKKEKGRSAAPFRNRRREPKPYFSSFHHLTLGTGTPPTVAAMPGGS